ncbi:MAG: permease-like cell division protein FtsX [Muribaculaceae bacterium]|nr:permease-like cell division protein FtsX [Muribaculaceae bacterium]
MTENRSRRISTFGSRITSLISVALVLVLLGLAGMMFIAGRNLTDNVRRNLGFTIKMERECSADHINALRRALLADAAVGQLEFSSADDILAQESRLLGEDIAALLDGGNPYAAEFEVKVNPLYARTDSLNVISARYASSPGVSEIVTESAVIEGVDSTLRRVSAVVAVVALVLLIVSVVLINNTISLSIYGRRFVIHTMKLVGATGAFIRRPFLIAGLVNGLIAGLLAAGVLIGVRFWAVSFDAGLVEALPWMGVGAIAAAVVLLGMFICVTTAAFATNRYLRASYDEMFLK